MTCDQKLYTMGVGVSRRKKSESEALGRWLSNQERTALEMDLSVLPRTSHNSLEIPIQWNQCLVGPLRVLAPMCTCTQMHTHVVIRNKIKFLLNSESTQEKTEFVGGDGGVQSPVLISSA